MKLMGFFNRDGGTFKTTDMTAYEKKAETTFRNAGHDFEAVVFAGSDIIPAMERAARRDDLDGIVAGGGDGTISAAASIAWKNQLTLGVIPAGTMNLFARSLQLPLDIWQALDVLAQADVDHVDIASANGKPFIHQFSAGLHARMVRYRNAYNFRSRIGKISASTRAAFGVIVNPPEFEVEFSAGDLHEKRKVSAVSVSNNPFGENALLYADDLRGGELGFYTARPLHPFGVAKLAADMFRGKFRDNENVMVLHTPEVRLYFPKRYHHAKCVMDGELLPLEKEVLIKIHPGELKALVRPKTTALS